jgi:hypothetical protein
VRSLELGAADRRRRARVVRDESTRLNHSLCQLLHALFVLGAAAATLRSVSGIQRWQPAAHTHDRARWARKHRLSFLSRDAEQADGGIVQEPSTGMHSQVGTPSASGDGGSGGGAYRASKREQNIGLMNAPTGSRSNAACAR